MSGPDLVEAAMVVGGLGGSGEPVDPPHRRIGVGGGEIHAEQVGGAGFGGLDHHPPVFQFRLVAFPRRIGVDGYHQSPDPSPELTGGLATGPLQGDVGDPSGGLLVEMRGLIDDHPGFGQVDLSPKQRLPDPGMTLQQIPGQIQLCVGGATGQSQSGPDLGSGQILGQLDITIRNRSSRIGNRHHRRIELGLNMGQLTGPPLHHGHPIWLGESGRVDGGQSRSEIGTRRHPGQTRWQQNRTLGSADGHRPRRRPLNSVSP